MILPVTHMQRLVSSHQYDIPTKYDKETKILTLLTAAANYVLQEGVLRGHEAPPTSRHRYLDGVNF